MKGMPKHLNSKYDYEYVRDNFSEEEWLPIWKSLYNERMNWFIVEKLDSENGINDKTHKVVAVENEGETEFYQYEYRLDNSSDFCKLGFTENEILKVIK